MSARTFVYVDGFNLYYRCLKRNPEFKWLNIKKLAEQLLLNHNRVEKVLYYSARVSAIVDQQAPARQQVYLDALATIPEIEVVMGNFLTSEKWMPLCYPPEFRPTANMGAPYPDVVKVRKTEEKGSDVNLGVHLVRDALMNRFDVAVVITNDTDLCEPIRIATQEAGKVVGLISPVPNTTPSLRALASFTRNIRHGHLRASQFPEIISDSIIRPASWISRQAPSVDLSR